MNGRTKTPPGNGIQGERVSQLGSPETGPEAGIQVQVIHLEVKETAEVEGEKDEGKERCQ